MLPRILLAAALALGALAAPASAADVTYNVSAFTFLKGTATGSDGDGWASSSSWETEIDQQIKDIPATDDQDSIVAVAPGHRIFVTGLKQDYSLATAMGTITWGCVHDGVAKSSPGSITMTRQDDVYVVEISVAEAITQDRDCTGFSSFEDTIEITPGPVMDQFTVPVAELEKEGFVHHMIDKPLPCGEWTIYQTACNLRFGGSVSIQRLGKEPPVEEKPIKKVVAQPLPGDKGAKVTVTCKSACAGKISAVAVATKRLKEKQIAEKSFANKSSSPRTVEIIYGKKGTRAVRQRGGVIINVRSGKQLKSARL